jgi:hypothetical protein
LESKFSFEELDPQLNPQFHLFGTKTFKKEKTGLNPTASGEVDCQFPSGLPQTRSHFKNPNLNWNQYFFFYFV